MVFLRFRDQVNHHNLAKRNKASVAIFFHAYIHVKRRNRDWHCYKASALIIGLSRPSFHFRLPRPSFHFMNLALDYLDLAFVLWT